MTEHIIFTIIGCATGVIGVALIFFFKPVSVDSLVLTWERVRLAEIEVKKLEAQHALRCPRLTDTPRKP